MIYLTYLTTEEGTPVWFFVHPKTPDYIFDKIAGKDHSLIVNFLSAVSMFGFDTLGSRLQIVEFEHVKMSYRYIDFNGQKLLAVALTDLHDNISLVWNIFDKFMKKNYEKFSEIIPSESELLEKDKVDKFTKELQEDFEKMLQNRVRKIPALGKRDFKNLLISLIVGILFYSITIVITYFSFKTYNLQNDPTTFFYLIIVLNFIIPAIFIGWLTGFWTGALLNGAIISTVNILVLSAIWWNQLVLAVSALFHVSLAVIAIGVLIVAGIIGAAMGLLAALVAWFLVETRTLVPAE